MISLHNKQVRKPPVRHPENKEYLALKQVVVLTRDAYDDALKNMGTSSEDTYRGPVLYLLRKHLIAYRNLLVFLRKNEGAADDAYAQSIVRMLTETRTESLSKLRGLTFTNDML